MRGTDGITTPGTTPTYTNRSYTTRETGTFGNWSWLGLLGLVGLAGLMGRNRDRGDQR
ncbi:hypothetical protein J2TS4_40080 [Paenibacillus sp. J2TS4]|nr:hypothetical protein J2TS4_40080 [Paenibacillus sp. J2TS4]